MASVLDRIAAARDKAKGTKQEEPYYGSNVLDRIAAARDEAIISTEKDRMMEERARENFAPSDKTVEALYGSDRQQPSGRYSSPFADRAWFMMGEDAWKAPIEKYAADKEVERLEGELSHAEEMYGTYSDLYGSWKTSPEEKAQALEWRNRFGAQIEDINGGALVDAKTKQAEATANYYATLNRRPGFNAGVAAGEAIDNGFKTSEIEGAVTNWEFFTDAEKDIYNYLLGTGGEEAAEAYWKYMQEPAQQRLGNIYTDRVQSIDPGFGRFLAERAYGIGAGVENALGGFMQATTEEELPTSGTQFGYYQMGEGKTGLDKVTYELGYQAGNMLPSMLLSGGLSAAGAPAKLAQLAGSGAMGFSAGGNAYKQGLDMGMTTEQAKAYGRLIGASEGGLQYVLGGIGALGGTSGKFAKAVKGIENGFLRFIAQTGGSMVSEATEEGLQAILDPIFRNAASGAEINIDWSEVAYNALMGGLMGGVFEAPGNAVEAITAGRGEAMYTPSSFKGENFAFEGLIPANVSQPGESGNSAEIRPDSPGLAQAREQLRQSALATAEKNFGREGYSAFEEEAASVDNPADLFGEMSRAYNDGLVNRHAKSFGRLTESQYERMFAAGRSDAAESVRTQMQNRRRVYSYKDAGIDMSDAATKEYVATLSKKDAKALNNAAKRFGVKIRFADSVAGGDANAEIKKGIITIEKGNPNPLRFLFGHEITHRMQELAPQEYARLRAAAAATGDWLDATVRKTIANYNSKGMNISHDAAIDEAIADYMGAIMEGNAELERFIARFSGERTLLERLMDVIREIRIKLVGTEQERRLLEVEKRLDKAAKAAAKQAQKNAGATKNAAQESDADGKARLSISPSLETDLKAVLSNTFPKTQSEVYIGETSNFLTQKIRASALPVYMPPSKAYANMVSEETAKKENRYSQDMHYHNLGVDGLIEALVKSEDPIVAFAAPPDVNGNERRNRVVLVTDMKVDGENVVVVEALDETARRNSKRIKANKTITAYDREQLQNDIEQAIIDHRLLFSDKKRSRALFAGSQGSNSLEAIRDADFNDNINAFWANVKWGNNNASVMTFGAAGAATLADAFAKAQAAKTEAQAKANKPQHSLKDSDTLVRDIVRIQQDGIKNKRSDAEIQADIRVAVQEAYQSMVNTFGAIDPGENAYREVQVPSRTAKKKKVSKTVRTAMEAQATPDEALPKMEELVATGEFSYEVYGDKAAVADARGYVENKGWDTSLSEWLSDVRKGVVSKRNTAVGWLLYDNAVNSGNVETAMPILNAMVEHQRNAAQAVQATRILKQLSPETQLYGVQRSIANLQQEINDRHGKKRNVELVIDQALADDFVNARTQEERDEALREIYRDIGRQMPSTFIDKFRAWRYLAMLGNPRTHGRNIAGNAAFAPVVLAKDLTASAIESAVYRLSGGKMGRSKTLVIKQGALKAAWQDYKNVADMVSGEGKYSDYANANKYIEEGRQVFKFKPLEKARRGNTKALEAEDMWFSQPHYAFALAQYCSVNGISAEQIRSGKGLDKAREYAAKEAQKATYRDTNQFSQAISHMGFKTINGNMVKKGVNAALEGVLPFRKTPANILVRGLEYSPLGLVNGIKQAVWDVQKGKMTAAEAIDNVSAGLAGTGLLAFGVYLAAQGLIRGRGGDDENEKEYEELMGHQGYALETPDGKSYTLDWLAPEALPFFIGVNLYEQVTAKQENNEAMQFKDVLAAVMNVTEPMLEMSCLQSLNELFEAVGYASSNGMNGLMTILSTAATSFLTQALPTLAGQAERITEEERMTTYTDKNSPFSNDMQYFFGKVSGKVPLWDFHQIPYIDAWGRTESTGGVGQRAFNNLLNPAYASQIEMSEMEKQLLELYKLTGEASVLPNRAGKYFNVGEVRKDLTAEEYVKYATEKGRLSYNLLTGMMVSEIYMGLGSADQVDAVEKVYEYANAFAKRSVSDYELDGWVAKANKAITQTGIKPEVYIPLYVAQGNVESLKDKNGETISNSKSLQVMQLVYSTPGLNEKQRQALFEAFGVSESVRHYNKALVEQKLREMQRNAK